MPHLQFSPKYFEKIFCSNCCRLVEINVKFSNFSIVSLHLENGDATKDPVFLWVPFPSQSDEKRCNIRVLWILCSTLFLSRNIADSFCHFKFLEGWGLYLSEPLAMSMPPKFHPCLFRYKKPIYKQSCLWNNHYPTWHAQRQQHSIWTNYKNNQDIKKITQHNHKTEFFHLWQQILYSDRLPMGSPLSSILSEIFLQTRTLANSDIHSYKVLYWHRDVDDVIQRKQDNVNNY